jgi:ribose 5-phosphate isomerase B
MATKILVGSDLLGMALKNQIKEHLAGKGFEVIDIGINDPNDFVPYFEISVKAAKSIQSGKVEKAVLCCGTGMGVAITANKFKGIYAGVVESEFTAEMCKVINNCNILTMGGRVISEFRALQAVDMWLAAEFSVGLPGDYPRLIREALVQIGKIEDENMK